MKQEKLQQAMDNYHEVMELRSWAHLFGFTLDIGRDGDKPFVRVDGIQMPQGKIEKMLAQAAQSMGKD